MTRDVEVQDAPAVMMDDEEAVQEAEGNCGHGEEVHGRDGFAVIVKKGEPPSCRFWVSGCPLHPARDGSLRYIETHHEKLAMNPRSIPSWVLGHHSEYQIADFLCELIPASSFSRSGDQAPVQAEARAMPADHGLGSDDDESLLQSGPEPAREHPKDFVQRAELGFGMLVLQYRELLAERQVLQEQASP